MKAIPNPAPQSSGYPLRLIEPMPEANNLTIASLQKESAAVVPFAKQSHPTDVPENWDESWFANYE